MSLGRDNMVNPFHIICLDLHLFKMDKISDILLMFGNWLFTSWSSFLLMYKRILDYEKSPQPYGNLAKQMEFCIWFCLQLYKYFKIENINFTKASRERGRLSFFLTWVPMVIQHNDLPCLGLLPLLCSWNLRENRSRREMLVSDELVYVEHRYGNLTFQMNQSWWEMLSFHDAILGLMCKRQED